MQPPKFKVGERVKPIFGSFYRYRGIIKQVITTPDGHFYNIQADCNELRYAVNGGLNQMHEDSITID